MSTTFTTIIEWLADHKPGHFTVERWGNGFAINVHRKGKPLQTILAQSPGELNRIRQALSDEGLRGFQNGAR